MENIIQTIATVNVNLRNLFKDKDHLVGVDDWDNFIGCLMALEDVVNALQEQRSQEKSTEDLVKE